MFGGGTPAELEEWDGTEWTAVPDTPQLVFVTRTPEFEETAAGERLWRAVGRRSSDLAIVRLSWVEKDRGEWLTLRLRSRRLHFLHWHDGLAVEALPHCPYMPHRYTAFRLALPPLEGECLWRCRLLVVQRDYVSPPYTRAVLWCPRHQTFWVESWPKKLTLHAGQWVRIREKHDPEVVYDNRQRAASDSAAGDAGDGERSADQEG